MTRTRSKRKLPTPGEEEAAKTTWTYWLSRDSLDGALSALCSLWYVKPLRTKIGNRITWVHEYGALGSFKPDEILTWPAFHTYPETDMELLVIETRPTAAELEEQKKKAKFT